MNACIRKKIRILEKITKMTLEREPSHWHQFFIDAKKRYEKIKN
jgi:hypothetical protein